MPVDLHGPGLWYATRAARLVALLMLTASVLLGVITAGRFSSDRWPRFLTAGLHRNISLLVLVFLALHVGTTALDTFVSVPVAAVFVPFVSSYKTFWLGLSGRHHAGGSRGGGARGLPVRPRAGNGPDRRAGRRRGAAPGRPGPGADPGHRHPRPLRRQQSAIVGYLNGGPAKPTFSPPRPHQRGVHGRPTLVNNVETLAHLALIARFGDRWFRGIGLPSAPGSTLVTVSGAVARPGVYEIEMGTPAGQVVMLAGGPAERPAALLVGGYFGAWLPAETAWPVPMCHAALKAVGGAMGAGMVIVLPVSSCGLAETARVARYLAGENAGQCGPCMFGLPALADAMADLAYQGGRGRALERVASLAGLVAGRGACRHPDGAVQLVRSALLAFEADARRHAHRGPCPGVARAPLLPVPGDTDWDWA